jgi:hypothetical protein
MVIFNILYNYTRSQPIPFILGLIYFCFSFGISAFGSCVLFSLSLCLFALLPCAFYSFIPTWLDFREKSRNRKNIWIFISVMCSHYLSLYLNTFHSFKHRKKNLCFIYILIFSFCSNYNFTGLQQF